MSSKDEGYTTKQLGANWDMFKRPCPECGNPVYVVNPNRSQFCSRQCESNYKYRSKFKESAPEDRRSPEDVRRL